MGTLYTRPYDVQIRVTNKLMPKHLLATFDTRGAAEQFMHQLEALGDARAVGASKMGGVPHCYTDPGSCRKY
jgi:hypothetical protein